MLIPRVTLRFWRADDSRGGGLAQAHYEIVDGAGRFRRHDSRFERHMEVTYLGRGFGLDAFDMFVRAGHCCPVVYHANFLILSAMAALVRDLAIRDRLR